MRPNNCKFQVYITQETYIKLGFKLISAVCNIKIEVTLHISLYQLFFDSRLNIKIISQFIAYIFLLAKFYL